MATFSGFCNELQEHKVVSRDDIKVDSLDSTGYIKGLLDCKEAQNCKYYQKHNKCELENN